VIIDSQPLSVAVLAALLFGESLSAAAVAGLFVGVAGLLLLEVPQELLNSLLAGGPAALAAAAAAAAAGGGSGGGGGGLTPAGVFNSGEFLMLLAAQSMAVGTVMVRWVVHALGWLPGARAGSCCAPSKLRHGCGQEAGLHTALLTHGARLTAGAGSPAAGG
jgi:drug/metabolite transporter (DMT)-like permease